MIFSRRPSPFSALSHEGGARGEGLPRASYGFR